MQHVRQIIFLSFFIFNNSLSQENIPQKRSRTPIKSSPLYPLNTPSLPREQQPSIQSLIQPFTFYEEDIEEFTFIFDASPKKAQLIVKHLQDPTYFPLNENYRSVLFTGEPGSGKTTMALSIGHKMVDLGWECKFLPSTFLLGKYRNQTAIQLQKELEAIEASKKPTILIIDELNRLLENTESEHHDTGTVATTLWTFIDKQKNNNNFFFIGTMNRINKLPQAYKSRMLFNYIEFPLIADNQFKIKFLRKKLTTKNVTLDTEVTDIFLNSELQRMGMCSGRDLKNLSSEICRNSRTAETTHSSDLVIKKPAITDAVDQYMRAKIAIDYDAKEETEEQRQNRHHKENQEMQERHFVQQQMAQAALCDNKWIRDNGRDIRMYNYLISLISDEQKVLYENMMKKTREREAREEAAKKKK